VIVVTGAAKVGAVLSADVSDITDGDGIVPGSGSLQWLRDGAAIAGATGAQYQLTDADAGAEIAVRFHYQDLFGSEEQIVSPASAPVIHPPVTDSGTDGDDAVAGGRGNDLLKSGKGDDRLTGDRGDDALDGGDGIDTAAYSGAQQSYTVTLSAAGTRVTDRRADGDGSDLLTNIEFLDFGSTIPLFDGNALDLRAFGGPTSLSAEAMEAVIELYIAYFNRAPDAVGLFFWGTAYANGTSFEEMARLFIDQPETRAAYPEGTSNLAFAETVYNNVLGRLPDAAGLKFWVGLLDQGAVQRDAFILEVLKGARAPAPEGADPAFVSQQAADQQYLASKTDIGAYFAVHKGMSDLDEASAAMALFDGTAAGAADAVAAIRAYHADALDPETGDFLMPLIGVLEDPFPL
jgi:hypothetical protein